MYVILIANKAVDSRQKQKKSGLLCKLDIEKAYYHVNWNFLLSMLQQMGFGVRWINWIKFCVSTVRFLVIINGSPESFFQAQRGLGVIPYPLLLFIIAMEGLNSMIKTANINGWIKGFEVAMNGHYSQEISHLQYADDTLIFCDANVEQLRILRIILVFFQVGVAQRLNNIRRKFLWKGNKEKKVYHLVKWKEVILSKAQGELGIRNLKNHSKAPGSFSRPSKRMEQGYYGQHLNVNSPSVYKMVARLHSGMITSWVMEPYIFALAQHQHRSIAEMWSPQGWNLILRRDLNDGKPGQCLERLLKLSFAGKQLELEQMTDDISRWKMVPGLFRRYYIYPRHFRILSNYLGRETMLAVVCKTHDGLEALEKYDKDGFIDKSSGLHGLGASMGRPLNDRFVVICVQNLSPYAGEFIADDPEKKLSIKKPRYLNDEVPSGFIGFAVNMINIDSANLYCVTSTGHGLRETLFYKLFSRLQVYKTRADMLQALPVVTDGAVSLDGGIIKRYGVSFLGERDVEIKFPKSSGRSNLPENYFSTERQMKELKWKRERFFEDLQREQGLLDHAKLNFETKKREFIKFLEDSSSYVSAVIN
ncbi:Protein DEFECTIVE IN MERISTEM SILENCING 3 [Capsicum annuum]|nr:Protein DEFECTIVE IN MERISTEM SILENCING 3 [Capsicum annuum]